MPYFAYACGSPLNENAQYSSKSTARKPSGESEFGGLTLGSWKVGVDNVILVEGRIDFGEWFIASLEERLAALEAEQKKSQLG